MDASDVHLVSQGSESACEVLERKDTKEILLALLQSIGTAQLSTTTNLPQDPILQLVHLAEIGLAQVSRNPSDAGSLADSSVCSSRSNTSSYNKGLRRLHRGVPTQKSILDNSQHYSVQPEAMATCAVEKMRVWKCDYCQKRFVSEDFLELHVVRRHPEFAGAGTERQVRRGSGMYTLPSKTPDFAHLQQVFSLQYEVLETSILRANSQKSKLQKQLEVLDPSSSASIKAIKQAIKLQQDLNQLLEQQKQLLTDQAEKIKEMKTGIRSVEQVSCPRKLSRADSSHSSLMGRDSIGEVSQQFSSLPTKKPHGFGGRLRRKKEETVKNSETEEHWSFESDGKMPSLLHCPSIPKESPEGGFKSASSTSRRARYKPSTRYKQMELSLSELKAEEIRELKEKATALHKSTKDCAVLQERYGDGLRSFYPHDIDEVNNMRVQIEREIQDLISKEDVDQIHSNLTAKIEQSAYLQIRSESAVLATQLLIYLTPTPDLPRSFATPSFKYVKLPQSLELEDDLHANQVPEPRQIQILSPMKNPPPPDFPDLVDAFVEGDLILRPASKFVNPHANRIQHRGKNNRESLISLDMENSASFSIHWEEEDEDCHEWRSVSIEDAKRLGFYPVNSPFS